MGAEVILHPSLTNTIDRDVEISIARATRRDEPVLLHRPQLRRQARLRPLERLRARRRDRARRRHRRARSSRSSSTSTSVTTTRERGWHGLGQPLKSFRDTPSSIPVTRPAPTAAAHSPDLGPLERLTARDPGKPEDYCHDTTIAAFRVPPSPSPSRRRCSPAPASALRSRARAGGSRRRPSSRP